jgi:acyl-CoA reductase-like NAD-dependent aldehyde dehydrogenase
MKSRNPVILSPHPAAKNSILRVCELMSEAAAVRGAPKNMFQCLTEVHMAGTNELMRNDGVALILATGGRDMVRAAYSSGRPALGVGPGNVPAFIERSADIAEAVGMILSSKTFDNGVICASEQAVVTENCIAGQVALEMERQGCYFLSDAEASAVARVMTRAPGKLNPGVVGHTACDIAAMAGLKLPEGVRVMVYREKGVGDQYPFSIEKLSPILAFYTEEDWHSACLLCLKLLNYNGAGHSLVIHSKNKDVIREFSLKKPVSRLLVNTPASQGAIGASTSLAPSLTLGCGAVGGSATSDNVTPLHLINIRRVAFGTNTGTPVNTANDGFKAAASDTGATAGAGGSYSEQDVQVITKKVIELLKGM